jgi:hypothetical protein
MSRTPERASLVPTWFATHRRPLVWLVVALLAAMAIVALVLGFGAHPGAQPFAPQHPVVFVGSAFVIAAYGFVFALLVLRVPENAVGWIFGIFALVVAVSNLSWGYLTFATEMVPPQLSGWEIALLVGAVTVPLWPCMLVALIVLFPDGRPLTPAWGRLIIVAGVITVVTAFTIVLSAGPLPVWVAPSPLAWAGGSGDAFAALARMLLLVLVLLTLLAVWSLHLRYRASSEVGRLQLKWLVYAGGVFVACGLTFLLVAGVAYEPGSSASTAVWLLVCLGAIVVPLAASIAILRYHLYEIETIIGRTLVYGGLTAILAGIYAAAIRFFNWLFEEFTGEHSDTALVLTTLVLATTLTPIKTWLEGRVAARRNAIADPDADAAVDGAALDAIDERVARRAAAIVLAQIAAPTAEGPSTETIAPDATMVPGPRSDSPAVGAPGVSGTSSSS